MVDSKSVTTGIGRQKAAVRDLLQKRDTGGLETWTKKARNPLRVLSSFLYDDDSLLRWRAIEALGKTAAIEAKTDLESVRRLLRRFFWMMNDESGNFCRYAPEAIGEILRNVPGLISEYGSLLSPFLVEEPFESGTRTAIARVAEIDGSCFNPPTIKKLIQTLDDPNPDIRGSSIIALRALGVNEAKDRLEASTDDDGQIELFDFESGELILVTVGELARDSIS